MHDGAKASIVFAMSSFIIKGISFVTTPIFTRILETSEYGIVTTYCINRSERATCTGFLSHPVVFREPPISEIESHSCIIEEAH